MGRVRVSSCRKSRRHAGRYPANEPPASSGPSTQTTRRLTPRLSGARRSGERAGAFRRKTRGQAKRDASRVRSAGPERPAPAEQHRQPAGSYRGRRRSGTLAILFALLLTACTAQRSLRPPAEDSSATADAAIERIIDPDQTSAVPDEVVASRVFAVASDYPPEAFGAYAIVAFPLRPNSATRERYLRICREFWSVLPSANELKTPAARQMVTVWPVGSKTIARTLNSRTPADKCEKAADNYDLPTALQAIAKARGGGADISGDRGPYLIAWAPDAKPDAVVLVIDLSTAEESRHFETDFLQWRTRIQKHPALWSEGYGAQRTRNAIRDWVDRLGTKIVGQWQGR
jgi:hypothetical protein